MNIMMKNIEKRYNGSVALIDCSVHIRDGGFHAIIGPNGSGKSTLLRIVSLLEKPDSGEVIYGGDMGVLQNSLTVRRTIAIVLPGDSLFNDSVYNNVAYGLKIRKIEKKIIRERVDTILERFKIEDKAHKRARELSSGEAQRVAVARALVLDPRCLFLDEPTASLDPVNMEIIETVLSEVNRDKKITILMVTHNMFQAKRIATRVIFMHDGRVIEESTSDKIFSDPEHEVTNTFITGTMVY